MQGARSVGSMGSPAERKAASLERQQMAGLDEVKSSLERPARTSLERHRQPHDRLGSSERAQKNGPVSGKTSLHASIFFHVLLSTSLCSTFICQYVLYR